MWTRLLTITYRPMDKELTTRQRMEQLLREMPHTTRDLCRIMRLPVKEANEHLEHLSRSLAGRGEKLTITPAECRACGFEFADRKRLSTPGKCPKCRAERIEPPLFEID